MTNKQLVDEIVDILLNDSEHPKRMLPLLADNCIWALEPGGTEYQGLREVETFIDVAMKMRGKKQSASGANVKVMSKFVHGDYFCIEYAHAFSFGNLSKKASQTMVKHCNVYTFRDGKIASVHEYTGSSIWWLNLATQLVLKRVWKKTKHDTATR